jgi:hypothetical protein
MLLALRPSLIHGEHLRRVGLLLGLTRGGRIR